MLRSVPHVSPCTTLSKTYRDDLPSSYIKYTCAPNWQIFCLSCLSLWEAELCSYLERDVPEGSGPRGPHVINVSDQTVHPWTHVRARFSTTFEVILYQEFIKKTRLFRQWFKLIANSFLQLMEVLDVHGKKWWTSECSVRPASPMNPARCAR